MALVCPPFNLALGIATPTFHAMQSAPGEIVLRVLYAYRIPNWLMVFLHTISQSHMTQKNPPVGFVETFKDRQMRETV